MGKFNKLLGFTAIAGAAAAAFNYLSKQTEQPAAETAEGEATADNFDEDIKALFEDFDNTETTAEEAEADIEVEEINTREEKAAVIRDDVMEIVDLVKGDVLNAFAVLKGTLNKTGETVRSKAAEVDVDDLRSKADDLMKAASEKFAVLMDKATEKLNALKEQAAANGDAETEADIEDAVEELKNAAEDLSEAIADTAEEAAEDLEEAVEEAAEAAEEAAEDITEA